MEIFYNILSNTRNKYSITNFTQLKNDNNKIDEEV